MDAKPTGRAPSARKMFTKAFLDTLPLPAPGERASYHDLKEPGLQLRVTSTGRKTFLVFKRTRGGRPERITIGQYPDLKLEQARDKAVAIRNAIALGLDPAQSRRDQRTELTLGEAFDWYLEHHVAPEGLKTAEAMRDNFARYLGALPATPTKKHGLPRTKSPGAVNWAHRQLSSILRTEVVALKSALAAKAGKAAANHALKLLRAIYNCVIRDGKFTGDNPAAHFGTLKIKARNRYLVKDELPRLFKALAATPHIDVRDFILLSILTGARRANVLALRWDDINLDLRTWTIPDTKNGEPVVVQLCDQAIEVLDARRSVASPWVFPGSGRSGHLVSPKRAVKAILEDAKIDNLRIHDLRRTLGSWQAIMGASLVIIGKSLGHKSVAATQVYAHLSADPVRASVARAADAMFATRITDDAQPPGSDE